MVLIAESESLINIISIILYAHTLDFYAVSPNKRGTNEKQKEGKNGRELELELKADKRACS